MNKYELLPYRGEFLLYMTAAGSEPIVVANTADKDIGFSHTKDELVKMVADRMYQRELLGNFTTMLFTIDDMIDLVKCQRVYDKMGLSPSDVVDNFIWGKVMSCMTRYQVLIETTLVHHDHVIGGFEEMPCRAFDGVKILKFL